MGQNSNHNPDLHPRPLVRYKYNYGESIPCEQLVSWLCDIKQAYTQYGGKRPFGVSILYKMYMPAPGSGVTIDEVTHKIRDHLKLIMS